MTQPVSPTSLSTPAGTPQAGAAGERGWGKLILALAVFFILPAVPQFRALIPVEQTVLLFVPAMAACALVGWWAGGRTLLALAWIGVATLVALQVPRVNDTFYNLARGWSLVLAGAFGLVCLFGARRPFFPRALLALMVSLALALIMSAIGPVSGTHMTRAVQDELARRNTETMNTVNTFIGEHPKQWNQLVEKIPQLGEMPAETEKQLTAITSAGVKLYPSLLALESIIALAIAWSIYHRLSRARLGPPLGMLRDFRFNDQFVWGLIAGITLVFLPTFAAFAVVGYNLLLFFGAMYALRGLGVLSWFMAPGTLAVSAAVGFGMLLWPVLNVIAALGFMLLGVAAFGLGLGDTWADWRSRARTTS